MNRQLPFSQACENNKQFILDILKKHLRRSGVGTALHCVLEIAGGTGQHAVFFAGHFSDLQWQCSDIPAHVDSLNLRLRAAGLPNLPPAIPLDVNQAQWDCPETNVVYSANSLHIMSAGSVENFFAGVGNQLREGGLLLVYGPFKYGGAFTTESNARFDLWLKDRDSVSGIRDFEWINGLAQSVNLELVEDNAMPANNQLLVWKRISANRAPTN